MLTTTVERKDEDQKQAKPDAADELIISEMQERYLEWEAHDQEFLKNSDEEFEFAAGDHWRDLQTGADKALELQGRGRSAMTIDLLNPSIELVVNPMRINKPAAKMMPVGEGATKETAEVRQGLYRNIDRESRAAVARETAHDMAVRVGRGYYRVTIEDEPGINFDRRVGIHRIIDLGCVMIDQTSIEPDYSDMEWGGIWDDLSIRSFRAEYGDLADITGKAIPDPDVRGKFFREKSIRRLEYFRRNWFTLTVAKLPPGYVDPKTGKPVLFLEVEEARKRALVPVSVLKKKDYKIQRFECSGSEILRRSDWPGKWIPIIVMVGREVFRGRRKPPIHSGMVRPAMGVTIAHDYAESRLIDEVALSPLPHMMAAVGQLDAEQEKIVGSINLHPWALITYIPKTRADGSYLPEPHWVSPSPNLAAVVQAAQHAKDNLQRVLNTYSPQLGQMQGDQSGRAIREVKDQGDISHAAFPDNANRALLHEARVVNDLMDAVYSEARAITITQPDDDTKRVLINQPYTDEDTGEKLHHLFGAGKYDVAMGTEQAWPTRQAEASAKMLDMAKVVPSLPVRAPDLLVEAIGLPGTLGRRLADRLRPADIDDKSPLPPIAQAKLAQMQQVVTQLTEALNQTSKIISEKRLELGSAERQTIIKVMGALIAADFKYGSQEAQMQYKAALQLMAARTAELESDEQTANPDHKPAAAPGAPPAAGAPAPAGGAPPSQASQQVVDVGAQPPGAPAE